MQDTLRQRLWRHIEALPEEQVYQVLDYIEFLSSKYARSPVRPASSSLLRFGERLEDKMRGQGVGLRAIQSTLGAMEAADRVFNGIAEAGRSLVRDVETGLRPPEPGATRPRLSPADAPAPDDLRAADTPPRDPPTNL